MDYEQFRASEPTGFKPPGNAEVLPLIVENHRFFIEVTLEVSDREKVTHRLRVDTGSEDSVADEVVKGAANVRETMLGSGLGENYKGYSGVFKAYI